MRCSGCGAENDPARRFCGECGARLAAACDACGFVNEPGAKFCGGCGAALGPAAPAAPVPAAAPAPAAVEGQRRQVTVLFADLCGYTALSSSADPELVQALLDRVFARLDGLVASFGGSVNQHIGDAVLALFGAPVAHDNDAERAVAAALAMHAAVADLVDPLGSKVVLHVGIASGVVVAAATGSSEHRIYTVTGESVNLASRLTDLARAGETLASDAVRTALGSRLRAESRGEVVPKGLDRPVAVWRVEALVETTAAAETPLVGRDIEAGQLAAALKAVGRHGAGSVVRLRGEAGIGKTRLVGELLAMASAEAIPAHVATILDFGMERGSDVSRQLALGLLSLGRGAGPAERAAGAERALAAGRVLPEHLPLLCHLLDLPVPEAGRAIHAMDEATRRRGRDQALVGLVESACEAGGVLVVVEDLHWADAATVDTLTALAGVTLRRPLMLVLTTRVDGEPVDAAWRAGLAAARLLTLDLGPLQAADAAKLADTLAVAEGGFVRRCVERAAGNPLFLEQLLHHAGDDSAGSAVPASIQSLVLARLDRLAPPDRLALQAASVLGQRFSLAALRHVSGDAGYRCDRLVARHFLQPDGDGFMFRHALIRDGVHGALLGPRRRELHGLAAQWFDGRDPVLHAEHLDLAGSPEAPRALGDAALALLAGYRADRALELAERGSALATAAEDRSRLARLVGDILLDLGRAGAALEAYAAALESAPDETASCRARIGLAGAMRLVDRLDEAMSELALAEPVAARLGLMAEQAALHHLRGNLHFPAGRSEECLAEHERSLRAAEASGRPELVARALGGIGDATYAQGRMLKALESFAGCVAMAQAHGLGRIEVANRGMVAICRCLAGPMASAREEADTAVALARKVGQPRAEIIACHGASMAAQWQLDLEQARAHIGRADELTARIGARRFHSENLAFRAEVEHLAGNADLAWRLGAEALEDARVVAPAYLGPLVAGVCLAFAPLDRIAAIVAEGERMLTSTALSHNHLFFFKGAMEAMLRQGDWEGAEAFADRLDAKFSAEPALHMRLLSRRARLIAALGRRPGDEASRGALADFARDARQAGYAALACWPERLLAA